MNRIKIEGIPPYDGEYDLDVSYWLNREYRVFKQIAGVRANEISEAISAGDVDMFISLAVIAMRRAGKDPNVDLLLDAEAGKISLVTDEDDEVEQSPPSLPSPPEEPPSNLPEPETSRSDGGDGTRNGGDASLETSNLHSIGSPSLDTSSASAQAS